MITKEDVQKALELVIDPEIEMDVWALGLIYDIKVDGDNVNILMTFTTPMCPFGPQLVEGVEEEVKKIGAKEVKVEITFEPLWKPSEELKEMLGMI